MKKERVDILLVEQNLFDSREQAKRAIMAGLIYNDKEERFDKPGVKVPITTNFYVKESKNKYASRGGYKLEKALDWFNINLKDQLVLDIGASTGGFTDLMLQRGANKSYALDVGYNQLAWKIRQDPRVIVMERTNFRYSKPEDFTQGLPSFASIDVSFISLRLILPALKDILLPNGEVVALVKPQFEAGKENVGKKGIVRDAKVHEMVLNEVVEFAIELGYNIKDLTFSPITGGEGNIEFLLYMTNGQSKDFNSDINNFQDKITNVVCTAHQTLQKGE